MFWNKHKLKVEDLKMLRTTSKKSLIDSALLMAKGDINKAKEIVDLYSSYMELPDFDPIIPSTFDNIKSTASNVFSWVKENKDDVIGLVDMIRNMKKGEKVNISNGAIPNINNPLPKL